MRENLGRKGRVSNKLKALLLAIAAVFAVSAVSASSANAADGNLKLTFTEGQIAVLPELLGPIEANPPEGDPVTVEGALAENGAFSAAKEGFNFPTQRIDLPEDPLVNSILGDHVNIFLGATNAFTGTFDRATGAFTGSIPLALTLEFSPPDSILACRLPFTLGVNTTGTLTFPGAGEGGADVSYAAAPFAQPSGNGAIYGSWPAVKFADIEDREDMPEPPEGEAGFCAQLLSLVPMLVPDWPEGLDGLEGEIWLGGKAEVTEPADEVCPDGTTGVFPDCKQIPVEEVKTCKVASVKVGKAKVKAGKKAKVKVTVKNTGKAACKGKVTLKSNKKFAKVAKSVAVNVAAGKSQTKTVVVKTTKKAKGKVKITATFQKKKGNGVVTVQKAKKKKKK